MGLFGLGSEILTEMKMDASQHKAELRELKDLQAQLGAEEGKAAAERNESLSSWIEGIGKVTLALVAVKELGEVLWDGYKEGIHEARLETAAMGVDIEKLGEAAHGLHTNLELLEFAAKANKSAFHLTQEQMEMAEKAMVALEHRGVSTAEAQEAVTNALVTGRTKGLEPYGIVVDKHIAKIQEQADANVTLAQKEELHANVLKGLAQLSGEVVDGVDAQGDAMGRSIVKAKDAWAEMKIAIGQLVTSMQPLIGALASVVKLIADIVGSAPGGAGDDGDDLHLMKFLEKNDPGQFAAYMASGSGVYGGDMLKRARSGAARADAADAERHKYDGEIEMTPDDVKKWEEAQKRAAEEAKRNAEAMARLTETINRGRLEREKQDDAFFKEHIHDVHNDNGTLLGLAAGGPNADIDAAMKKLHGDQSAQMTKDWQTQMAAYDKNKDTVLERTFGKVGDFDLYKEAFKSLEGAVGSSMKAWIDGSMSAGQAFKKFIGEAISGLASQMLIESLKHTAYSLGSLAFGDVSGAAKHAVAAAEFGIGAAAAGLAAREMGAGTSASASKGSSSSGATAGSGGIGSSATAGAPTQGPIIVYGDSFSDDSARMRQLKAQQMVNKALGTSYASGR